ncbi:cytotoxic granule associated RNA binding protein TIA1-like isoform X2 [Watersipora subatra]|uniref:cytotoxic granule associated RNA binding protein TIA1-like isoform X2 n=1 Tax=Watersipora subatra TaxID=2589382 RepID=UPI00355AD655
MISPNTTSLMYPYLYPMPQNPAAQTQNSITSMLPNLNNGALTGAPQVSTPNLIDHNLSSLTSMGSLQNLANINGLLSMRMNWSGYGKELKKVDTTDHHHIFVGDISQELEVRQIREAFNCYGEISDVKIIKDTQTGKSKGYGFVTFVNKEDAQKAITEMNGAWIGSRAIRTNWASRKPPTAIEKPTTKLDYDEVFKQSSATNCTVYIGGIQQHLSEELMRETFHPYGNIQEVRVFADKGFAFVRFDSKESACKAIVEVNGTEVGSYIVKCSWGKESNETTSASAIPNYTPQLLSQLSTYPGLAGMNAYNLAGAGLANTTGMQGYNSFNPVNPAVSADHLQALNNYAALNAGSFPYGNGY